MSTPTLYDEEVQSSKMQAQAKPEGQNLIRASLFNLIVLSLDPERTVHCENLIRIITQKFPCKIIFLRADPHTQSDFLRTTENLLTVGSGNNTVLCDQMTIEASANQFVKIPFLILPNIQPDLPIYILIGQDPSQDAVILPQLKNYACRVLFDTESIDNFKLYSQRILNLLENTSAELVDLNWARTKAWRESLARAFNNKETLSQLKVSKTIQISYAASPNPTKMRCETQAVYLQAWLAARLGWNLLSIEREEGYLRLSYKYDHMSLSVSLVPKITEILEPGALFAFEAMTQGDYHFLISHENDNKTIKVHASNPERCEMPYTIFLNNFQNGPALVNEIFYQPPSQHYLGMLRMLDHPEWTKC
jgi:hypothetical protein